ncbi:PKD domain-containing protein [Pararcticibacter amylolyticus]|nr:PKD domain-containing protein [Pararcticibacter amylolyticus]
MKKFLLTFSVFFVFILKGYSQDIGIQLAENGIYGRGSSIAVKLTLDETADYFKTNNEFTLYLSDATGNFANETEIGRYAGFYSTFLNGRIPTTALAGNYKLRVKASNPAVISLPTASFEIKTDIGVLAEINAPALQTIENAGTKAFGSCTPGKNDQRFNFTNGSSYGAEVSAVFVNESNGTSTTLDFNTSPQTFTAKITHYTVFVRATLNGITGTKAFFLINNMINTPFNPPGSSTVCLPLGALEYNVETTSTNGIQMNFPGNTYQVTWGDGIVESYNLRRIKASNGKISHVYTKSSCGSQINIGSIRYYNVFGIVVQSMSPYCGNIGVPVSSQAKVIVQPENRFFLPTVACINTSLAIPNSSIAGEDPSSTSPSCQNNNVVYYWYVNNTPITPQGVPLSWQLNITFKDAGYYKIRLESQSTSECQADPVEKTIYVQKAPVPDFKLNGSIFCSGATVKPENKSVIDTSILAVSSYKWAVSGPAPAVFLSNTKDTSPNPEIGITKAGIYTIKLSIISACKTVTTGEQTFIFNESPGVNANWATNLCGKGHLLTFSNTSGNPVQTTFTGTYYEQAANYKWEVSGGAYSFGNGTTSASKEPSILFKDYGVYTVSVTYSNNCGTITTTRKITFNESPTVSAGNDLTICPDEQVHLNGSITGPPVLSFEWKGGTGTFMPGRNVLNPQYIPSSDEIAAGKVDLVLSAITMNPAPCNIVEDVISISINPLNKITTAKEITICTGSAVNYNPVSSVTGSTFKWTASGTANASGYHSSGTGPVNDVIINTDASNDAIVTYTIIPESNGCQGESFTLKVKVSPLPVISFSTGGNSVCTGLPAGITLSSNLANTLYRWTSSVTGNLSGNSTQNTPVSINTISDILQNSGNTSGTVTYTVVPVTSSGCEGTPATITITVSAPPVIANAGTDQKLCNVTMVKLDANHPGEGNGKWTLQSGQKGVSFDNDTHFDAVVSGLVAGETYRFLWTITGPFNCQGSSDEVLIRVLPPITLNDISTPLTTVCEGSDFMIYGTLPTGGDGNYSFRWETSEDGSSWSALNTLPTQNIKVTASDTTWFRRIVTSGDCSSYSNEIKVNVQEGIRNNTLSGDQYICSNIIPSIISGSAPGGADGIFSYQWEKRTSGNSKWTTILTAVDINYQPEALTETTMFRRIVTTALCNGLQQNVSNVITIKVSPGPRAHFNWKSDASCAPFSLSSDVLKAEDSEPGDVYTWYVNDKKAGTGQTFPGLTLPNPGDSAIVKLEVASALGCGSSFYSHTFRTSNALEASFTADKIKGCGPLNVKFTNTTSNTQDVNFTWDFGNGKSSGLQDPSAVVFEGRKDGRDTIYTVTLTATSKCSTSSRTIQVKVIGQAIASFVPTRTTGCSPLTVTFRNTTKGESNTYIWDFGDGSDVVRTDSKESVTHTYKSSKPRMYTTTLTVVNECGSNEQPFVISISPNTIAPELLVNGNEFEGCAPHKVRFINGSAGASIYTYDFGDNTPLYTTNSSDPVVHSFAKGGVFTVKMTASNGCSDTTVSKTITVYPQAVTDFAADQTTGCTSLAVNFLNRSTGAAFFKWEFGDGSVSDEASPSHTYEGRSRPYTVKLISVTSFGCTDTLILKDYITVYPPPVAAMEVLPGETISHPQYGFQFKDASTGNISSRLWDFGDKSDGSSARDPEHTYPDTGAYEVKLMVTSAEGCVSTITKTVRITGVPGQLFIPNAFMPNSVTEELRTFKVKGSGIKKWQMRIFNKWGEQIWQTRLLTEKGIPAEHWDGTSNGSPVPQGVYFWEISAEFKNGTQWAGMTYNHSEPKRTGAIHLIR